MRSLYLFVLLLTFSSCVQKKYSARALKKDTRFFYEKLEEIHPNVRAHYPAEEYSKDSAEVFASLKKMDKREYLNTLKPIMAKIADGHTRLEYSIMYDVINQKITHPLFVPINIVLHQDTAYAVKHDKSKSPIPFGSRIISINGKDMLNVVRMIKEYNESYVDHCFEDTRQFSFRSDYWDYFGEEDQFNIVYETPEHSIDSTCLKGIAYGSEEDYHNKWDYYNYINAKSSKPLLENFSIKDANKAFSYRIYHHNDFAYLIYHSCRRNDDNEKILKDFFRLVQERGIQNIVIDVRRNWGGSTDVNDQLLQYIAKHPYRMASKAYVKMSKRVIKDLQKYNPEELEELGNFAEGEVVKFLEPEEETSDNPLLFKGNVYVLAGAETFSSGAGFVSVVQDCGLGKVVGRETGGMASAYGDYFRYSLPHSRLKLKVPTKFIIRPDGDATPHGVYPDYEVKYTLEDKLQWKDLEAEKVIQLIRQEEI